MQAASVVGSTAREWLRHPAADYDRGQLVRLGYAFAMAWSLLNQFATVRQGAFLPHWTVAGATYHTVFRLADSLPSSVVDQYRREREALLAHAGESPTVAIRDRLSILFSERIDRYLDAGAGRCWLGRPDIASVVVSALQFFEGARYELHAWCVMPNHAHVVVDPARGYELAGILHSWKSFTANEANKLIRRSGPFWQKESYDHIVRDPAELARTREYVQTNPQNAGLHDWAWVWP